MSWSNYADPHECADLLTYLVMSQLLKHSLTGEWLTAEHAVEFTHLWMHANGPLDLLARASLASRAQALAVQTLRRSKQLFDANTLATAFVDPARLDYRSAPVIEVHRVCMLRVTSGFNSPERWI